MYRCCCGLHGQEFVSVIWDDQALRYEFSSRPELLGSSSVFSYGDVFDKLARYIRKWRKRRAEDPAGRCASSGVFIVTMDVASAFDSIPIQALWQVNVLMVKHRLFCVAILIR